MLYYSECYKCANKSMHGVYHCWISSSMTVLEFSLSLNQVPQQPSQTVTDIYYNVR